jgi:hypothetical protein
MREDFTSGSQVVLDACCLINLLATGRLDQILADLPYRFVTSSFVASREVLALASSGPGEREIIPSARLESLKDLQIVELATEQELTAFVRFAAELDDGEASVCALAAVRGGVVATDDRKALRLLSREFPARSSIQTPELLWEWSQRSRISSGEMRSLLLSVRDRARFLPRWDAPHFAWWSRLLEE